EVGCGARGDGDGQTAGSGCGVREIVQSDIARGGRAAAPGRRDRTGPRAIEVVGHADHAGRVVLCEPADQEISLGDRSQRYGQAGDAATRGSHLGLDELRYARYVYGRSRRLRGVVAGRVERVDRVGVGGGAYDARVRIGQRGSARCGELGAVAVDGVTGDRHVVGG